MGPTGSDGPDYTESRILLPVGRFKTQAAQSLLNVSNCFTMKQVIFHANVPDVQPRVRRPEHIPLCPFTIELEQVHRATQSLDGGIEAYLRYGVIAG
jgi:hypothetical protein